MPKVTAEVVRSIVCAHYGISVREICATGRRDTKARHVAFYLTRKYCPHMSYPTIGRFYGGRDHSTVMLGDRGVNRLDPDVMEVEGAIAAFENGCEKVVSLIAKRDTQTRRILIQMAELANRLIAVETGNEMKEEA